MNSMLILKKEINLVEKMIRKDIASEATVKNLYEHIFKSNGKKIRARLNLISSSLNRNKKHRIRLAAIIELLHTATLVHDDVVDDSSIRRGNRSVNSIWSNAHGVLIGDYIYSKAFIYMVDIGNQQILKELSNAISFNDKPSRICWLILFFKSIIKLSTSTCKRVSVISCFESFKLACFSG